MRNGTNVVASHGRRKVWINPRKSHSDTGKKPIRYSHSADYRIWNGRLSNFLSHTSQGSQNHVADVRLRRGIYVTVENDLPNFRVKYLGDNIEAFVKFDRDSRSIWKRNLRCL